MPYDYDDWDWDTHQPIAGMNEEESRAYQAAIKSNTEVRKWAVETAPVLYQRDWWRATCHPVAPDPNDAFMRHKMAQYRWAICAEENRPGLPHGGEWIGGIDGKNPPTEEQVAALVAEWEQNCE